MTASVVIDAVLLAVVMFLPEVLSARAGKQGRTAQAHAYRMATPVIAGVIAGICAPAFFVLRDYAWAAALASIVLLMAWHARQECKAVLKQRDFARSFGRPLK